MNTDSGEDGYTLPTEYARVLLWEVGMCKHCHRLEKDHVDRKCLFDHTDYDRGENPNR